MIMLSLSTVSLHETKAKAKAVILESGFDKKKLQSLKQEIPSLEAFVKERSFNGDLLTSLIIPYTRDDMPAYLILIGIGKSKNNILDIEHYRRVIGKLVRLMEEFKISSLALELPNAQNFEVPISYLAGQTALMAHIADYHFDEYITQTERKTSTTQRQIILVVNSEEKKEAQEGIKKGEIIATSVNKARHWIDLPPTVLFPTDLAQKAAKISEEFGLKYTVFNEKEINKMGMGGLAGVSRGSDLDCELVIMEYKTDKKNAPTICFVGKGITFDSGGLSIKPANHMETMKEDMSGAAAVIASMASIAQLKPNVNVIGIAPLAENLPSGKAIKPGDIVRFYNGKTAEIKNTDAEGRLILADALSYAVKHYSPAAIIDIATLTGSCAHALGPFYCGLMSEDEGLVAKLKESSWKSGDRVWPLPLHDDYKPAIKSIVADISNIGSQKYLAGAITAALFLKNFVDDVPWAHLDIAGTAFDVPDLPYYRPHSATGFGVRLLVDIAMNW